MKVIPFTLTLQEPLLATVPGGDPNSDESQNYVPGSTIRGALASRYLKKNNADDAFHRLFLNGETIFLNAYPKGKTWARTLPPPRHWTTLKDDNSKKIHNLATGSIKSGIPKPVKNVFVEVAGKTATPLTVEYEIAVHNARDREKGRATENEGALFRYQALATGQQFTGAIAVVNADDIATLKALFIPDKLLLGGSRSAGYGLTLVELHEDQDDWDAWRKAAFGTMKPITANEPFTLYLASDMVLRDPLTGQECNDIIAVLNERLPGYGITAVKQTEEQPSTFTQMEWVGGFNQKWGLPLPQSWAISKGSIWLLQADKAITVADITRLEQTGIGDRRAEGYGRLIFNPDWLHDNLKLAKPKTVYETPTGKNNLSELSQKLVNQMNERIMRRDLDRFVIAAAQQNSTRTRGNLSNSQLARLRLQTQNGLPLFQKYLQETRKRKSADDQFGTFTVGGDNFRETLETLAENPSDIWDIILDERWVPSAIGQPTSPRDGDLTNEYAIRYIDAVCKQVAKKRGDK